MRRSLTSSSGLFAVAVPAFALLCSPAFADKKKKQDCFEKQIACYNRCADAAAKKYGTDPRYATGPSPAGDANAACARRTCDHQFKACAAAEKESKKAPLAQQRETRSPAIAPMHPLTPQKITRSPASVPATPITSQNTTRAPAGGPRPPLTSSPSFRRGGR